MSGFGIHLTHLEPLLGVVDQSRKLKQAQSEVVVPYKGVEGVLVVVM